MFCLENGIINYEEIIDDLNGMYYTEENDYWYDKVYTFDDELLAEYVENQYTLSDLELGYIPSAWYTLDLVNNL